MVSVQQLVSRIKPKKILLLGDCILDSYIYGSAKRISPEAPVPVVLVKGHEEKEGGAANVAKNLRALNMEVTLASIVGDDKPSYVIQSRLEREGTRVVFVRESSFVTPEKARVIAAQQQVVRLDYEQKNVPSKDIEDRFIDLVSKLIPEHDLVAFSDYAKGALSLRILQELIHLARQFRKPTVVDPKGADFTKYSGATLVKPNLGEAYQASGLAQDASLQEAAQAIFARTQIETLMVTKSEEGISLFYPDGKNENYPTHVCELKDGTGAGDTALAAVSAALANGCAMGEAATLANIAAGCSVEHLGCAAISLNDIVKRQKV